MALTKKPRRSFLLMERVRDDLFARRLANGTLWRYPDGRPVRALRWGMMALQFYCLIIGLVYAMARVAQMQITLSSGNTGVGGEVALFSAAEYLGIYSAAMYLISIILLFLRRVYAASIVTAAVSVFMLVHFAQQIGAAESDGGGQPAFFGAAAWAMLLLLAGCVLLTLSVRRDRREENAAYERELERYAKRARGGGLLMKPELMDEIIREIEEEEAARANSESNGRK